MPFNFFKCLVDFFPVLKKNYVNANTICATDILLTSIGGFPPEGKKVI